MIRLFVLFFYLNKNSSHKANQEIKQLKNHFVRRGWRNLKIKCITWNSRMNQKMKISWAWNRTFLMISCTWNNAEPFWLFKAPETDTFWRFAGPEWVKKALFYFLGLNESKRCNFRPRKSSKRSRDTLWGMEKPKFSR